ncbi:DUF5712 family protein [Parabacteroides sp. PF5-9]|uniref:DUF5712 family protein n=1 Tax=Parabacteroides sp. PF5-9 TaxID=1742404 RepID=UPI002475811C|nr:DUF5712 family protein [Parabacteroides sp. PF5-9]MDH6357135.1 hypothetical protein [Parabacteroides sp. PF5-9]
MYTKVICPGIHGRTSFANTGSCSALVNYLNKENKDKPLIEKEMFFNQERNNITSYEVIKAIDGNRKGLSKRTPKFHSLVIAPDKSELQHIKNNPDALKEYVRDVMELYAQNFNLKDGRKLSADDLVWFGKLEYFRKNKDSKEDMHVHIVVSARDKSQTITLNPNVNNKQRFNRVNFSFNSEKAFDLRFSYERKKSLLFTHQTNRYGSFDDKKKLYYEQNKSHKAIESHLSSIVSINFEVEEANNKRRKRKLSR